MDKHKQNIGELAHPHNIYSWSKNFKW